MTIWRQALEFPLPVATKKDTIPVKVDDEPKDTPELDTKEPEAAEESKEDEEEKAAEDETDAKEEDEGTAVENGEVGEVSGEDESKIDATKEETAAEEPAVEAPAAEEQPEAEQPTAEEPAPLFSAFNKNVKWVDNCVFIRSLPYFVHSNIIYLVRSPVQLP